MWHEVVVSVPVRYQAAVIRRLVERGASGVQEEYAGLADQDESGPIVSGDPAEWGGEAPANRSTEVVLRAWIPAEGDAAALAEELAGIVPGVARVPVQVTPLDDRDWNAPWKAQWKPTPVGRRLLVCPSWEAPPPDTDRLVLHLDPGMAFGTGTHFTTLSCLELFEDWLDAAPRPRPLRVLDVGTGTGILAIGALLLGADSALGIDVDPVAVDEARENAARNGMTDRIRNRVEPLERHETPVEVVFANILGPTIVRLADALADAVAPGGVIFCSGILATQERNVQRALARRGLERFDRRRDGEWVSLAFERR